MKGTIFDSYVLPPIMLLITTVVIFGIIGQQRWRSKVLWRAAFYDEFCDCPNLSGFHIFAQEFIDKHRNSLMLMIEMDIDNFRLTKRTLGKEAGNCIMQNMAAVLRENVYGEKGCFARAHDDTFYILYNCQMPLEAESFRQNLLDCFAVHMDEKYRYKIRFVFGVYQLSTENCLSVSEAVEKASIAHNRAKTTRVNVCEYDETFIQLDLRKRNIENLMEGALEREEFVVYLQAQNCLKTKGIRGAEALVRWKSGMENLFPDEFIPIFEENNFIIRLDMYIFDKVCQYIRQWLDYGLEPVVISVNFARNHLETPAFDKKLCRIADKYRIPHHLLGIELTERVIAENGLVPLRFMMALRRSGFNIYVDDFGSGHSSLGMLKNIPVDVIKLDKSFLEPSKDESRAQIVVANIIRLAKELEAVIIAEGVETRSVADLLSKLGCDAAQGYYFSRPIPESEFRMLLRAKEVNKVYHIPLK